MARSLFVFGLGFTGERFAERMRADGWTVAGTATSEEKAEALCAGGFGAQRYDGTAKLADPDPLLSATHVLSTVPPGEDGDPVLRHHFDDIADGPDIEWIGYLSTTGVYGDTNGGWVDESAPLKATTERAIRRVAAEAQWHDLWWEQGQPVHVFRLAGIYGPGRSAIDQLQGGRAKRIYKAGHAFSRIHVDDIVTVLAASVAAPDPGTVYNVCDDLPAGPDEVVAYAADLLGVEPPPLVPYHEAEADMSAMARSFWQDNRRVRNARIKDALGVRLRYPSYREGLRAILVQGES